MWFRFSRPDYFYTGHYRLIDAGDESPFNRGISIGLGFSVLHCRWNVGRTEIDGIHHPQRPAYRVKINGDELTLSREFATYDTICALAGKPRGATVIWRDKQNGRSASMAPGDRVLLTEGMIFDAVVTGAA